MIAEPGSELASELWDAPIAAASSILSYAEGRAALAAARRARRLTPTPYRRALEEFESLHGELLLIGADDTLTRHAGELAERLELRGYDAIHLASALALGADTTFVTWDRGLQRAAFEVGFAVSPADRSM